MNIIRIPAAFIRGGTSKGVFFHSKDLPADEKERDKIFLKVLGSPDPYQRQLNGLGGGLSSLSKAAIISPSSREDADIDYTFAQVAVDKPIVDYSANCGNLSSAVGPFAIDEGLLKTKDGEAQVRVFNTNTKKYFNASFRVQDGKAITRGELEIPGVADKGAAIRLDFIEPDGAATGKLLPTGNTTDEIKIPNIGKLEVSLIDASNPVVFVEAKQLNVDVTNLPDELERQKGLMQQLETIRCHCAVLMGLAKNENGVALANPKIALVGEANDFTSISNETISKKQHHINMRVVSMERIHKVVTLTSGMCLASASQIPGTLPYRIVRGQNQNEDLLIGNPSGVLPVRANMKNNNGQWRTISTLVYRTQRRLMDGFVYL